MTTHIVQSPEWEKFKNEYGTPAFWAGDILLTKHQIPFTNNYFAYCPKVDPLKIDFAVLKEVLEKEQCINANFDVPLVEKGSDLEEQSLKVFEQHKCKKSPREQFASSNVLLDISTSEKDLLKNMHKKHRYNLRYAQRNGVTVSIAKTEKDFDIFYDLFKTTSKRQQYFVRSKVYYKKVWELLRAQDMCFILTAEYEGEPLASWMFFVYEGVLYYPYGGSSEKHRNLQASTLVCWEGIKLGKQKGCHTFDMWGAGENVNDKSDPWWGFTNFKLRFGGRYVKYMDSYDFVINSAMYKMFSVANSVRWRLLNMVG